MGVDYRLGKAIRDTCFPYSLVMVFGAELNQVPSNVVFGCAPEIVFETTVFDLTPLTINHEVAIALVSLSDITGNRRVEFDWYRARDHKLLFSYSYTIPAIDGGGSYGWYYIFSYIGWTLYELSEDGAYQVEIQVEGVGSTTIGFTVKGITPVPSPPPVGVQLPAAVRSALDSGWANLAVGEWGSFLGINFPPFGFEPGRWALKGLDAIIDAVNWVYTRADEIWDKAYNAFILAGNAMTRIENWVGIAYSWFSGLVSAWWSSTFETVKAAISTAAGAVRDYANQLYTDILRVEGSVVNLGTVTRSWQTWLLGSLASIPPINTLIAGYNKMESFYSVYLSQIGDFFKDPPGFIFDKIDNWLSEKVT